MSAVCHQNFVGVAQVAHLENVRMLFWALDRKRFWLALKLGLELLSFVLELELNILGIADNDSHVGHLAVVLSFLCEEFRP